MITLLSIYKQMLAIAEVVTPDAAISHTINIDKYASDQFWTDAASGKTEFLVEFNNCPEKSKYSKLMNGITFYIQFNN